MATVPDTRPTSATASIRAAFAAHRGQLDGYRHLGGGDRRLFRGADLSLARHAPC